MSIQKAEALAGVSLADLAEKVPDAGREEMLAAYMEMSKPDLQAQCRSKSMSTSTYSRYS